MKFGYTIVYVPPAYAKPGPAAHVKRWADA